jgi:hypothetical protein
LCGTLAVLETKDVVESVGCNVMGDVVGAFSLTMYFIELYYQNTSLI